jgi:pyruvate/2-oxoglutarate/acetoin dehydrogenase E1 component
MDIKNMIYKDMLNYYMNQIGNIENSIFIGQQIVWRGNPMSTTLDNVSKDKMIEVPVMEETQMGMSLGLAMTGYIVITFYPRWDFLISAANQLINHIDKYELMTGIIPHIIIRVGKGSDTPLNPGHQHKANYINEFKSILKTVKIMDCQTVKDIQHNYKYALDNKGIYIINEYPEKYYE